jgi:pimeloyl-ACP methyl ester carboxylesterase
MFVEGSDPGLRDKLLVRAMEFNPTYAENLLADNIRWELEYGTASIKEIAVPVMLLQSTYTTSQGKRVSMTDDVKTPFMELVAKVVPNAEIRTITGIGHFTMIEAAGKVNRCLRNFAERVS